MTTYIVTIELVVSPEADEHLQTTRSIEDEITSWLTGLHPDVRAVTVTEQS